MDCDFVRFQEKILKIPRGIPRIFSLIFLVSPHVSFPSLRIGFWDRLLFFIFVNIFFISFSYAEFVTLQVRGEAELKEGNFSVAQSEAVNEARKNAVEIQLAALLSEEALVINATLVDKTIYSQIEKFVVRFSPIGQPEREGDILSVTIDAVVDVDRIKRELTAVGLLVGDPSSIRILPIISYSSGGNFVGWWFKKEPSFQPDIGLINFLREKGFNIINPYQANLETKVPGDIRTAGMTIANAQVLGKLADATHVIRGEVRVPVNGKGKSEATLQIIDVKSGKVVSVSSLKEFLKTKSNIESETLLVKSASERLMNELKKDTIKRGEGTEDIEILVLGAKDLSKLAKLEQWLKSSLPGVSSFIPRRQRVGEATYNASIKGSLKSAVTSLGSRIPEGARVTLTIENKKQLKIQVLD